MKIFDYNTNAFADNTIVGHKLRIEGTIEEVNKLLNSISYREIAEGHEADGIKRVYVEVVKMTIAKIMTIAKKEIKANEVTKEELENNSIVELLQNTCDVIRKSATDLVTITKIEWTIMESIYCDFETIEEAKQSILMDVIENKLCGTNITVLQRKKQILKEIENI